MQLSLRLIGNLADFLIIKSQFCLCTNLILIRLYLIVAFALIMICRVSMILNNCMGKATKDSPLAVCTYMQVDMVIVPATTGQMGVLPGHTATMTELKPGILSIQQGNETTKYFVSGGFAFIHSNSVADIITVEAVTIDKIDPNMVKIKLAEYSLKLNTATTDYEKAEAQIGVDVHNALQSALAA